MCLSISVSVCFAPQPHPLRLCPSLPSFSLYPDLFRRRAGLLGAPTVLRSDPPSMAEGQETSLVVTRGGSHQAHAAQPSTNYSAVCRAILIHISCLENRLQCWALGQDRGQEGRGRNLPVTDQSLLQETGTFQGGELLYSHLLRTAHTHGEQNVLPWLCWNPGLESDSAEFKSSPVSSWCRHQPRACL